VTSYSRDIFALFTGVALPPINIAKEPIINVTTRVIPDTFASGACESSLTPVAIAAFSRMRALSTRTGTDASRPFDVSRDGFVMGEGAAALVLEEAQHAIERGADIICEIRGYAATCDATHITASDEEGSGGLRAMQQALGDAGLSAEHVDHINAHATSTPRGDAAEAAALNRLLQLSGLPMQRDVSVTSVKGALGHLLAAAGLKPFSPTLQFVRLDLVFVSRLVTFLMFCRCGRSTRHSIVSIARYVSTNCAHALQRYCSCAISAAE
jgi:hypothetical protein